MKEGREKEESEWDWTCTWGGGGELKQGEILASRAISWNRREVSEAVSEFNS